MTWVLYFGLLIECSNCDAIEVKSYTVTDPVTCRRIEMGVAMGKGVRIETLQFGLRPATWAKCVRKEPVS